MRQIATVCVITSLMLISARLATAQARTKNPEEAKITKERDRLLGTWAVIGFEEAGEVHMYGVTASYWKFGERDVREWLVNAEASRIYPLWRSDPTSKPRKLDYAFVDEPTHEILINRGVYEIDGDNLSWTFPQGFGGNPKKSTFDAANKIRLSARPTQLGTARGDGSARWIMKRVTDATEAMSPEERKGKSQETQDKK